MSFTETRVAVVVADETRQTIVSDELADALAGGDAVAIEELIAHVLGRAHRMAERFNAPDEARAIFHVRIRSPTSWPARTRSSTARASSGRPRTARPDPPGRGAARPGLTRHPTHTTQEFTCPLPGHARPLSWSRPRRRSSRRRPTPRSSTSSGR